MKGPWYSEAYTDRFTDAVRELVNQKVEAGETERVAPLEDAPSEGGPSNVVDLTELLARSLAKRKPAAAVKAAPADDAKAAPTYVG